MTSFLEKRNNALNMNPNMVNGRSADIHITEHGSDWYWAACAVMGLSTVVFAGLAFTKPRQNRIFCYITAGITLVSTISYFTQASNLGWVPIDVEFHRSEGIVSGTTRQIYYVRWVDYFITLPLILLNLLLTAGMPWPTILWIILVCWSMVVNLLIGALVTSQYKWGYFAFACTGLFYIVYHLVWESRLHARAIGSDVGRAFLLPACSIATLWILYPVAWGVSEGGNVIAPDSEAAFYGVIDVLSKPVVGLLFLWGHKNIEPARLGLYIRDYTEDPAIQGGFIGEKRVPVHPDGPQVVPGNGHTNGDGVAHV